jgi:hypothetical protein
MRAMRRGDVQNACGVALSGVPVQDRLLRLVGVLLIFRRKDATAQSNFL